MSIKTDPQHNGRTHRDGSAVFEFAVRGIKYSYNKERLGELSSVGIFKEGKGLENDLGGKHKSEGPWRARQQQGAQRNRRTHDPDDQI